VTRPQIGFRQYFRPCRSGHAVFEQYTVAQLRELLFSRNTFDLYPISFFLFMLWIGQLGIQLSIIGQQQQALRVAI